MRIIFIAGTLVLLIGAPNATYADEAIQPPNAAMAGAAPAPTRPAATLPDMQESQVLDELMKQDYSAESFKLIQANPEEVPVISPRDDANPFPPTFKDEMDGFYEMQNTNE